ncbi:low molecular weight protein arginine phosphatase [Neobacillus sp. DY30]|uniref:low molecular weight protein arginine phosphatase n=1 Tax=Neobacillus sp. DY30 TaxID=3047871 RepID=UPI0024C065D8|nr:low molecular weight protein arginine phosphatase [Neobacillus sp. DY30]WHY00579.1 low molecular weight protein arginine phosphatase [Neobacillus sp. DY30]
MKRILFVCTGNTCRSPMAEAILKSKKIDGLEVKSAGIYAATGSEASAHAKKVMDDNRIEHNHLSNMLTFESVHWADLILTMTFSHKSAILQQYPETTGKVFTLKEFTGEEFDVDVVDPFGGNLAIYQETYRELDKLIAKAIEKIQSSQ